MHYAEWPLIRMCMIFLNDAEFKQELACLLVAAIQRLYMFPCNILLWDLSCCTFISLFIFFFCQR